MYHVSYFKAVDSQQFVVCFDRHALMYPERNEQVLMVPGSHAQMVQDMRLQDEADAEWRARPRRRLRLAPLTWRSNMDHRTLTALKGSIKKWEGIVAGTEGDEGIKNCPLCQEFWNDGCVGCPVRDYTGYESCDNTPYDDWAHHRWESGMKAETPEDKQQAQAMLDFLKSLLPDNSEK